MRVLLVKLSSLGDVIHNLPVVSDLVRARPQVEIDWAIESPYAEIAAMHPAVKNILPVPLRNLKKRPWSAAAWREFLAGRSRLARNGYDRILDTQGLVKSAWVARWPTGPVTGYAAASAREPMAARSYDQAFDIPRDLHAVTRNRMLAGKTFDYEFADPIDYGLPVNFQSPAWLTPAPYAVFLHATSRINKMWPDRAWRELATRLHSRGLDVVYPWGNGDEHVTSRRLAHGHRQSIVPPPMALAEAAAVLAKATVVVGVDTGLAHLAVALGRPTIGIYITTQPRFTGLFGNGMAVNVGGGTEDAPIVPSTDAVWRSLQPGLD